MSRFLAAGVALAIASSTLAQYSTYGGYSYDNPVTASVSNIVWERINARLVYKAGLKRKGFTESQLSGLTTEQLKQAYLTGKLPGVRPASAPQTGNSGSTGGTAQPATRFKPTGSRVLMPQLVDGLTADPAHRKALKDLFAASFAAYEAEARKNGFENDLSYAIAFFAAAAFQLQDEKEPSDAGTLLVAKALRLSMDTPGARKLSDVEKQRFYEFMVTMGSYLVSASMGLNAESDKAALQGLRSASADVLKAFLRIDPTKVRLTETGFEKR